MKKAVIATGAKQYLVTEGDTLDIELVKDGKVTHFVPLLVIDGEKISIGTPEVTGVKVTAEIVNSNLQENKVTSIRYKAKKRVHTVKGHRQHKTQIIITKIA